MVKIAVPAETDPNEGRVAITPDTVKRFKALGADIVVQAGAGESSRLPDSAYTDEGAEIAKDAKTTVAGADVILRVRRPSKDEMKAYPKGAMVVAQMDPTAMRTMSRRWPRPASPALPWSSCRASPAPR
jgi:NAD(P) transhydrogenase subunit alpha